MLSWVEHEKSTITSEPGFKDNQTSHFILSFHRRARKEGSKIDNVNCVNH